MASDALPDYVRALQRPNAYPHAARKIELIQTHISFVFLVDDEVYKLKKPVDLGFVDFRTLEQRRRACENEVMLNRRGCPGGVYIGVEPITRDGDSYRIGGDGEPIEYAVHMKRLPADGMMDALLARDAVDFDMLGRVAARLAELHRDAERGAEITRLGGFETMRANWQESIDQIEPFIGHTLSRKRYERISSYSRRIMQAEEPLLRARVDEGWVRDCHGDLRCDSVCFCPELPGGICIYDCIEFNERFRYIDTGLDAAFLAMDLDYRGRPDLSDLFVGLYSAAIGDKQLPVLLDFFKCYRAVVRGKVESLLLNDPQVGDKQKREAARRARAYFKLAESYALEKHRRSLVVVSGPSGSGKSVLAGVLAGRLGAVLLSTDMLRRELFEQGDGRGEAMDAGRYAPESRDRVYDDLRDQAEAFLKQGRSVVADGTYIERRQREPILRMIGHGEATFLLVECSAPDEVVRERQTRRESEPWTTSEGRWEIYLAQKQRTEPATEVPQRQRLAINTTTPLRQQIDAVIGKLEAQ